MASHSKPPLSPAEAQERREHRAALAEKSDKDFADYLVMVADDQEDSGRLLTAEDYREAAERIYDK